MGHLRIQCKPRLIVFAFEDVKTAKPHTFTVIEVGQPIDISETVSPRDSLSMQEGSGED